LDTNHNFTAFYLNKIKENVRKYIERVKADDSNLVLGLEIDGTPPWQKEDHYSKLLVGVKTFADLKVTDIQKSFESLKQSLKTIAKHTQDRRIATLSGELTTGAFLQVMWTTLVETNITTFEWICGNLEIDYDEARKRRLCYLLVKEYNLIMYSGVSLDQLDMWRSKLQKFLKHHPGEAMFLTAVQEDEEEFTFAAAVYQHSVGQREKIEKIHEKEKHMDADGNVEMSSEESDEESDEEDKPKKKRGHKKTPTTTANNNTSSSSSSSSSSTTTTSTQQPPAPAPRTQTLGQSGVSGVTEQLGKMNVRSNQPPTQT